MGIIDVLLLFMSTGLGVAGVALRNENMILSGILVILWSIYIKMFDDN